MAAAAVRGADFLAELVRLETVHDDIAKINRRHNNNVTVTGFRRISTSVMHPICNRHGRTYVAELNGSEEQPYLSLKFKDAPEHDPDGAVEIDSISSINTDTVEMFIQSFTHIFECALVEKERSLDTWTFHFNIKSITMEQCASLLQHPSAAVIDVVLTLDGVTILYSARSDSKNNLRYLKKNYPQYFVPKTSASDWMYERSSITTACKSSKRRKFNRSDKRKKTNMINAAYSMLGTK